ncbi:MAG: histidine phosphatase family protein [Clostridia bacterium]|nr:histidine phosphatase family protein [Clostridia bacterium]
MAEGTVLRELYLIRHGESTGNAGIEAQTPLDGFDPVLSPKGEDQADRLGRLVKDYGFDAVYSSGLRRAVGTAAGIIRNGPVDILNILPDLCETGVEAEYTGQTIEELRSICPGAVIAEGYEDSERLIINDETPGENETRYFERAAKLLDYLASRFSSGEKIALVSHAAFLTYVIFYIIGYRDKEPNYDFRLTNTGITKIVFYTPGTYEFGDTVFDYINDTRHLP